MREDREGQGVARPAHAVVEDRDDVRGLAGSRHREAWKVGLGRRGAAAVEVVGQQLGDFAADVVQLAVARVAGVHDPVAWPAGQEVADIERAGAADADRDGVGRQAGDAGTVRVGPGDGEAAEEVEAVGGDRREPGERQRTVAGRGEDPEFPRLEDRAVLDVGPETLAPVGRAVRDPREVDHPPAPAALGRRAEVDGPVIPGAEGEAHRRGVGGVRFLAQAHRDIVGVVQYGDRREGEAQVAVFHESPDEQLAGDVGRDGDLDRSRGLLAIEVVQHQVILPRVHPVVAMAVVGGATVAGGGEADGVGEMGAGAERRDGRGRPVEFLVKPVVITERVPGRSAGQFGGVVGVDRERVDRAEPMGRAVVGDIDLFVAVGPPVGLLVGVEEVGHAGQLVLIIRGPRQCACGELAGHPGRVGELEGEGKVDLQATEARVAVHPARPESGFRLQSLGDRRRGRLDEARAGRQREQRELLHGADARIDAARWHGLEAAEDFHAGARHAAQGLLFGLFGRRAGRRSQTRVGQVEARFDAFVADPVGIGPADAGVRQRDPRQGDASVGFAEAGAGGKLRGGGAGIPHESHHVEALRVVGGVPREMRGRVVGDDAGKGDRLDAGGSVVPAADEPGGRLRGFVGTPHAGPQGVPDRRPIPALLHRVRADVRARRGPAIGPGFLLQVGERQAERDHRLQAGPAPGDGVGRELRFDFQERDERDDHDQHQRHDGQREHQREAAANRGARGDYGMRGADEGHGVGLIWS